MTMTASQTKTMTSQRGRQAAMGYPRPTLVAKSVT